MPDIHVRAVLDDEAGVWVVESDDMPGLITEVVRREDVYVKVPALVMELAELNNVPLRPDTKLVYEFIETRTLRYA